MAAAPSGPPRADPSDPSDPFAMMRTKQYAMLLVAAGIIGAPIAAAAYGFLQLTTEVQGWLYEDLPDALGFDGSPAWWPFVPLGVAGVLVGAVIQLFPGRGGETPVEGFKPGGLATPIELPGIALASIISIGFGAVVGPEGPLVALGGGLAYLAVWLVKRDLPAQAAAVIGVAGSFAAIATLLGSPLTGAFLLLEASGLGGPLVIQVLMPGLLAAGVGSLVFIGVDSLAGKGTFTLAVPNLPVVDGITGVDFLYAIAIGAIAVPCCFAIRWLGFRVRDVVERKPLLFVPVAGLLTAGAAILYAETTVHTSSDVLFSGETTIGPLIEQGATYSLGALVLLLACKGFAYVGGLGSFRGGPTFPAMFLGAAGGIALSHLPGLDLMPGVAMGIGAMTAGILRLPMTTVLLTTLFLGADGITVMPLVIVAVVVSFVLTQFLPDPAPHAPSRVAGGGPGSAAPPDGAPVEADRRAAASAAERT